MEKLFEDVTVAVNYDLPISEFGSLIVDPYEFSYMTPIERKYAFDRRGEQYEAWRSGGDMKDVKVPGKKLNVENWPKRDDLFPRIGSGVKTCTITAFPTSWGGRGSWNTKDEELHRLTLAEMGKMGYAVADLWQLVFWGIKNPIHWHYLGVSKRSIMACHAPTKVPGGVSELGLICWVRLTQETLNYLSDNKPFHGLKLRAWLDGTHILGVKL